LDDKKAGAAPGSVRRAEEFMRANASLPLTIAEIAEAVGCSVRARQIAFHRFRGTTPMRVGQQTRLEQARSGMLRAGQTESLARIAAEHGFSSPTRFAQSFRRKYGVYPSEMLRERHDTVVE
jgi:transcriptional regulator GlxA family with amidase domain